MRVWVAIVALVLLAGCSGASHPAARHPTTSDGAVVNTNCPTTTTLTLPSAILPNQESIKQAGQNGGGCYDNRNGAHPLGPGTSAP